MHSFLKITNHWKQITGTSKKAWEKKIIMNIFTCIKPSLHFSEEMEIEVGDTAKILHHDTSRHFYDTHHHSFSEI